jgi:putative PIN family toxin of toxin-antitoxin system
MPPTTIPDATFTTTTVRAVVIDTQVLLDWLVFRDPSTAGLVAAIEAGQVDWVAEDGGLAELRYVAQGRALAVYEPSLGRIDEAIARHCRRLPTPLARACGLICRDADDQRFIDLAITAQARWLITRDKDLLALRKRAAAKGLHVLRLPDWSLDSP